DQGGECDLQDQAMAYGHAKFNRFEENKRAVTDKNMGPLVNTIMTRCIHCTRCVRFAAEVAGVDEIGATGRGEDMEITTYLERAVTSEMSGNVIDLCPVGALTSKPYKFNARPWELTKTESVDVMDAVGSAIRVDARGPEVMRILPRTNEDVNEEWISDKTRFACDGLRRQRLDRPYVRRDGKLQPATWAEAFAAIAVRVKATTGARIGALAGDLCAAEEIKALKDLMQALKSPHMDCRQDGSLLGTDSQGNRQARQSYLFNTNIAGIEQADAILLIGTNPRWEAPLINARIRKTWLRNPVRIFRIGPAHDLTYPVDELGANPQILSEIAQGHHAVFQTLKDAKHPMLIVGPQAYARADGAAILALSAQIARETGMIGPEGQWNGFNVLHTAAARVGALDLGFLPGPGGRTTHGMIEAARSGELDVLYLLGTDELPSYDLGQAFVIYQGHHGDRAAHRADVILPGAAYTEKNGTYVNTEGRVQLGRRAIFPPGDAREDWTILRALSEHLGAVLQYDTLEQLRAAMLQDAPHIAHKDLAPANPGADPTIWTRIGEEGAIDGTPLKAAIHDFYLTNAIARASQTMAECSRTYGRGGMTMAAE
ncbi:MAG TPA: NADH-quinone oxidoreductase subunit G, partial [Alphaproteobacteria bacterium]|nr:NADH-quinone oxidoreductase subunit G [Alphaproteobacteria bacterium]